MSTAKPVPSSFAPSCGETKSSVRRVKSGERMRAMRVGVLNSVVSLYYYARIVRTMFLDFPTGGEKTVSLDRANGALLILLAVFTVVLGIYWAPLIAFADRSARFLLG